MSGTKTNCALTRTTRVWLRLMTIHLRVARVRATQLTNTWPRTLEIENEFPQHEYNYAVPENDELLPKYTIQDDLSPWAYILVDPSVRNNGVCKQRHMQYGEIPRAYREVCPFILYIYLHCNTPEKVI